MSESAIMAEMAELKQTVAKLDAKLAEKALALKHHLPFTSTCQAVVDRFRVSATADLAIREAWPFGKSHFYYYKRLCPQLQERWEAVKVERARARKSLPEPGEECSE